MQTTKHKKTQERYPIHPSTNQKSKKLRRFLDRLPVFHGRPPDPALRLTWQTAWAGALAWQLGHQKKRKHASNETSIRSSFFFFKQPLKTIKNVKHLTIVLLFEVSFSEVPTATPIGRIWHLDAKLITVLGIWGLGDSQENHGMTLGYPAMTLVALWPKVPIYTWRPKWSNGPFDVKRCCTKKWSYVFFSAFFPQFFRKNTAFVRPHNDRTKTEKMQPQIRPNTGIWPKKWPFGVPGIHIYRLLL